MATPPSPLTPMDLARYYMSRIAMRVDEEHFQELCRTVAYALDPAETAYRMVLEHGMTHLLPPAEIMRAGELPSHAPPRE
jgi:hypothetical protein